MTASHSYTFAFIKPDAFDQQEDILRLIREKGFSVLGMSTRRLPRELVTAFYAEHAEKDFFGPLCDFMTSGPVVALALGLPSDHSSGPAWSYWRSVIGPTDSNKARTDAPDSLRAHFGTDGRRNALHGSSSQEEAERELSHLFPFFLGLHGPAGDISGAAAALRPPQLTVLMRPDTPDAAALAVIGVVKRSGLAILRTVRVGVTANADAAVRAALNSQAAPPEVQDAVTRDPTPHAQFSESGALCFALVVTPSESSGIGGDVGNLVQGLESASPPLLPFATVFGHSADVDRRLYRENATCQAYDPAAAASDAEYLSRHPEIAAAAEAAVSFAVMSRTEAPLQTMLTVLRSAAVLRARMDPAPLLIGRWVREGVQRTAYSFLDGYRLALDRGSGAPIVCEYSLDVRTRPFQMDIVVQPPLDASGAQAQAPPPLECIFEIDAAAAAMTWAGGRERPKFFGEDAIVLRKVEAPWPCVL
eukprot:TRINITY_DN36092_c0_g1_i1.p1 TRINITY_DN36092_c0_g1~~TRINITY_DN36092_c0_g1_i1.p1  ORF type:complete len:475 (-),score=124.03 TRINITY_DN36092_c0_g1_i1:226-1650(-)